MNSLQCSKSPSYHSFRDIIIIYAHDIFHTHTHTHTYSHTHAHTHTHTHTHTHGREGGMDGWMEERKGNNLEIVHEAATHQLVSSGIVQRQCPKYD